MPIWSSRSSNRGMGKQYLTVILLIALLSTHIRHEPSFLGMSKAGTAQGLRLSRRNPLRRVPRPDDAITHARPDSSSNATCWVRRHQGIRCWISLRGGKPSRKSSGKTSENSLMSLVKAGGMLQKRSELDGLLRSMMTNLLHASYSRTENVATWAQGSLSLAVVRWEKVSARTCDYQYWSYRYWESHRE